MATHNTTMRVLALVLGLALVAAACGDDDDGGGEATETTAATEDTAATETTAASETQFPTGLLVHDEDSNNVLEFNDDGTWAYYGSYESQQDPNVTGTYSVDGNLYTEDTVSAYCNTPATYAWTYDGQNLTFEESGDDECAARRSVYLGRTYTKSE